MIIDIMPGCNHDLFLSSFRTKTSSGGAIHIVAPDFSPVNNDNINLEFRRNETYKD